LILEVDSVPLNFPEILLCLFICGCSQSFVVLDLPGFKILNGFDPVFEVAHCIEGVYLSSFGGFEERSDELFHKTSHFE
jgi:hypothetical protein